MRVCVFVFFAAGDIRVASSVMHSAAANLVRGHANLSFPSRAIWDKDANDADLCCESWGGASPDQGGPSISYVLWGADGQGSSGFKTGPEGFAAMGAPSPARVTIHRVGQTHLTRIFASHVKTQGMRARKCVRVLFVWPSQEALAADSSGSDAAEFRRFLWQRVLRPTDAMRMHCCP